MFRNILALLFFVSLVGCNDEALVDPDVGRLPEGVTASPDGQGYCCIPEEPSCDGPIVGGFIEDSTEDCGQFVIWDAAPPSFWLMNDEHGCEYYEVSPGESCNPVPPDGGL